MNFDKLTKNIIEVLEEQQIKLGYRKEKVRLYYPLSSLNVFLGTRLKEEEMGPILFDFSKETLDFFGGISFSNKGDRFCLAIPPEGVERIHNQMNSKSFLSELIKKVEKHGTTMDEVIAVFHKHSEHVHVEKMNNGAFDYLVYFEDGNPDEFRYCIKDEKCHIIYHRFTIEDYNDFDF